MGRKRASTELIVYMNDALVGNLVKSSSGLLRFRYDEQWLEEPNARPLSLSLPLREQLYEGEKVYHFFDNLLPDNQALRARIQKRFNIGSNACFDILSHIGTDCVGAIRLLAHEQHEQATKINAKKVADNEIAKIINNYQDAPLGMSPDSDFRISIAGAQEKTAFLKLDNQWHIPLGATPTTHIFKFPIGNLVHHGIDLSQSVENEWLCLQILAAYQLPVNHAEIHQFDGCNVLVCERFDRKWNQVHSQLFRLPQEDMCQAFGLSSDMKYESDGGPGIPDIMSLLNGSLQANENRVRFFKTCIIFWLMGAIDGHAKNHSIFILPQGQFTLTPIYDVISAYPLAQDKQISWNKLKMAMSVRGKNKHYHWNKILLRHWQDTAQQAQLSKVVFNTIIEDVFDNIDNVIEHVEAKIPSGFPESIASSIFSEMKNLSKKIIR